MSTNIEHAAITPEELEIILEEMNADPKFQTLKIPEEWEKDFLNLFIYE